MRGLSDGYRDEPDGLFINRPVPREVQHVGFAEIPFISDERAVSFIINTPCSVNSSFPFSCSLFEV